jgi:hypothetical protein
MTLVELVVAAGLMTILIVTLLKLVDDFLGLWEAGELRRRTAEEAAGVLELLAGDLATLESGPRGDLLAEWVFHDTDGDGTAESMWPRLRFVRHASARELALAQAGRAEPEPDQGLLEVFWAVLPARAGAPDPDLRAEGVLWRGERLYGSAQGESVFDPDFLSATGRPAPGSVEEASGGVLWLGMEFATQTTLLYDGWELGAGLAAAVPSWDAWKLGRANVERHEWNEFGAGLGDPAGEPLLPRRVRLELELERARDLKRRTRVARLIEPRDGSLVVEDGSRLPTAEGAFVRIGAEWMRVVSVVGDTLTVRRGARGTAPGVHTRGALVHWGATLVREVPLEVMKEDWAR